MKPVSLFCFREAYILLFSLTILFWQCSRDSDTVTATQKIVAPYEVSLDEAVRVAQNYNLSFRSTANKGARTGELKDVDTKETIADENNRALFHIINYAKGGFAIVSADLRAMPILAYSSSTNQFDTKNAPLTNGLSVWYNSAKEQMKSIEKGADKADSIVIKEWKKYLNGELNLPKGGRTAANTNCQEWYTTGQYMCQYSSYFSHNAANPNVAGPLFSYPDYSSGIAWGQDRVANFFAPNAVYPACTSTSNAQYCGRYPAGCGPVAMAQILWYYKQTDPTYSAMPHFSGSSYSSACSYSSLGAINLASLMNLCAVSSSSVYGFAASCNTLTVPSAIPSALHQRGLSNGGSIVTYSPSSIETEVYQGHPVILHATNSGPIIDGFDQHIWVCDGFDEHRYSEYNCDTKSCDQWAYLFLYMNWGWNGSSNGWYAAGNFSPTNNSGNWNLNVEMITGIRN